MKPIVISGCSGGGKSTLIAELRTRGHVVVPEAGRRVVAAALRDQTDALPWLNPAAFVRACVTLHLKDLETVQGESGRIFLDRSIVDVISFLPFKGLSTPPDLALLLEQDLYDSSVFMTPAWPALFSTDAERRHSFEEAAAEYRHLRKTYLSLGFRLIDLPCVAVTERADFIEDQSRPFLAG